MNEPTSPKAHLNGPHFPHEDLWIRKAPRKGILNVSVGVRVTGYHPTIMRSDRGCRINTSRKTPPAPLPSPLRREHFLIEPCRSPHQALEQGSEENRSQGPSVGLSPVLVTKLLPLVGNSALKTAVAAAGAGALVPHFCSAGLSVPGSATRGAGGTLPSWGERGTCCRLCCLWGSPVAAGVLAEIPPGQCSVPVAPVPSNR